MAVARICDTCGKTTTNFFYRISIQKNSFNTYTCTDWVSDSNKSHYDLCQECMNKFKKFMDPDKKG